MDKLVPLISSDVKGPLGVVHLPRLWLKLLLSAKGMLPADYDECGTGFDQMTLDGLGLDRDAAMTFVKTTLPTYPRFERWVLEQKGGRLDPAVVERTNASIRNYIHPDPTQQEIRSAAGISERTDIRDAVTLNKLEDWTEIHHMVAAG